jgi:thioredoxin-related protein
VPQVKGLIFGTLKKGKEMNNSHKIAVFAIVLFLISGAVCAQTNGFNDALKTAKDEDKRVIVDIYTDWCGWCKKMDSEVYGKKDIKEIVEENFVFVKLNAESSNKVKYNGKEITEADLAVQFQATGYPTTIFLEPDGKVIEYKYNKEPMNFLPGYIKASDYKKILIFIANGRYKDTDLSTIVY